jgi:hypothetical protein
VSRPLTWYSVKDRFRSHPVGIGLGQFRSLDTDRGDKHVLSLLQLYQPLADARQLRLDDS